MMIITTAGTKWIQVQDVDDSTDSKKWISVPVDSIFEKVDDDFHVRITQIDEWVATINFRADADRLLRMLGYDLRQARVQAWLDTRRTSRRR